MRLNVPNVGGNQRVNNDVATATATAVPNSKRKDFVRNLHKVAKQWRLWVMAAPAIALLFVFAYMPMGGLVIAFKRFDFSKGIWGSPWNTPLFNNFVIVVNNPAAWRAIRNTLLLNLLFIVVGTCFAIMISIMLNEIRAKTYKKITQSLTLLPFFISWVVVGLFASGLLNYENGVINRMLEAFGMEKVRFYMEPKYWPFLLLFFNMWKGAGYSAILYLATITGFSPEYYEAADIDGASRWQRIRYITLPLLKPTIIILTLLALGGIMRADFGLFFFVTSDVPALYPVTDVLDTFVYRALRVTGSIGISSAAGFFQSVVSLIFVLTFNWLANKFDEGYGLF